MFIVMPITRSRQAPEERHESRVRLWSIICNNSVHMPHAAPTEVGGTEEHREL